MRGNMDLHQYFSNLDSKFDPIILFLFVSPISDLQVILSAIEEKYGIMRDFCGFEFEENNSLTFYDFTSDQVNTINVPIKVFVQLLDPIIIEYKIKYPNEIFSVNNKVNNIFTRYR